MSILSRYLQFYPTFLQNKFYFLFLLRHVIISSLVSVKNKLSLQLRNGSYYPVYRSLFFIQSFFDDFRCTHIWCGRLNVLPTCPNYIIFCSEIILQSYLFFVFFEGQNIKNLFSIQIFIYWRYSPLLFCITKLLMDASHKYIIIHSDLIDNLSEKKKAALKVCREPLSFENVASLTGLNI